MASNTFFLYTGSNDIAASCRFYSDLIGLDQIWDATDHVAYKLDGGVQFSISYDSHATVGNEWSFQPGWAFGLGLEPIPRSARASWSVPLAPGPFHGAVERLQQAKVEALRPEPFWVGYWSYVVKDPMGQTVELTDPSTTGP